MVDVSLSPAALAYCAVVLVASYALRGSTGFGGFAAMPLMALAVPMTTLVPLWTLLVITSSATLAGRDRHHVAWRDIVAVVPASLVGIVVVLYVFTAVDGMLLARAFGALVLAYAFHTLWKLRGAGNARTPSRALARAPASSRARWARCSAPCRACSSRSISMRVSSTARRSARRCPR